MDRNFKNGLEYAKSLDTLDPLHKYRERFYPLEGRIYMDGNSLGLCSKDAEETLLHMLHVWKTEGINIWATEQDKFFHYPVLLGEMMAPLLNADPNEIIVTTDTTTNIHKALSTFYKPTKERYKILVDDLNFPTDRYAIDSHVRQMGYSPAEAVTVVPSADGKLIDEDTFIAAMKDDVALILLPGVLYRSAQLVDMEKVTKAAHERGILIGWDLCHSIGSVPHDFKKVDPDFAVWCTYKHLNGGPGSCAGLYINKRHFNKPVGMAGWFGNKDETQFQLKHEYDQAPDAAAWQTGSPNLLSMAPLEGSLRIFHEATIQAIREKSLHITAYMMYLIDTQLAQYGYGVGNPREDAIRGGHIALEHDEAYRICSALKANNIIPDFREPNVIRLAPIALYNSYEEVYQVIQVLEAICKEKQYEKFSNTRSLVV